MDEIDYEEDIRLKEHLMQCIAAFEDTLEYCKQYKKAKYMYDYAVKNDTEDGACAWFINCNTTVDTELLEQAFIYVYEGEYEYSYITQYNVFCTITSVYYSTKSNKFKCNAIIKLTEQRIKELTKLLNKLK